jgi:hypothetical protein
MRRSMGEMYGTEPAGMVLSFFAAAGRYGD